MSALEPHDGIGAAGQPIDDLALAFITPLGADHGYISHWIESLTLPKLPACALRQDSAQGGDQWEHKAPQTGGALGRCGTGVKLSAPEPPRQTATNCDRAVHLAATRPVAAKSHRQS
ncbi:hypothetical protein GCM10023306_22790 [Novosphingobium ginsenosidimutans]